MNKPEHILTVQNRLGETPIWVPEEKSLYWVDFIRNTIFRLDAKTKTHESFQPDMAVRGLCRRDSGGWLVVTAAVFSLGQGIIHPYYSVALAPAIGALVGIGAWIDRRRRSRGEKRTVAIEIGGAEVYAEWSVLAVDPPPAARAARAPAATSTGSSGSRSTPSRPWSSPGRRAA